MKESDSILPALPCSNDRVAYPRSRATLGVIAAVVLTLVGTAARAAPGFDLETEIRPFSREASTKHAIPAAEIEALLSRARPLEKVLKSISRPAEGLEWRQYRKIFIKPERISKGAEFLQREDRTLRAAEARFGVPPEIVTAIIGVETFYGTRKGNIAVLDSLATLAFRYPRRSKFFASELGHFIALAREESLDIHRLRGSYAGAMGIPQFISSSYRSYAVDFDGDGRRDLLSSVEDAIGSVANYLSRHGWRHGEPISTRARVTGNVPASLIEKGAKPHTTLQAMARSGVVPGPARGDGAVRVQTLPDSVALIRLRGAEGDEYHLVFDNFYAITRYNHSNLYAMAVTQLARQIRRAAGIAQ